VATRVLVSMADLLGRDNARRAGAVRDRARPGAAASGARDVGAMDTDIWSATNTKCTPCAALWPSEPGAELDTHFQQPSLKSCDCSRQALREASERTSAGGHGVVARRPERGRRWVHEEVPHVRPSAQGASVRHRAGRRGHDLVHRG